MLEQTGRSGARIVVKWTVMNLVDARPTWCESRVNEKLRCKNAAMLLHGWMRCQ